jgi:transposase
LDGTGSFAAGLAGELAPASEDAVEVGALRRARGSTNDRLDAVRATRTAVGRDHQVQSQRPRPARGNQGPWRATHPAAAVDRRITTLTLQSTTTRIRFLTGQLADIDPELAHLIHAHPAGPALLAEPGVGPVVAAQPLISWSHPGRSEAKLHSPRWPESRRWKPAAANTPDTASTAAETGR